MWAGRQALWWFFHGYAPGLTVTKRYRPSASVSTARRRRSSVQRGRVTVEAVKVPPGRWPATPHSVRTAAAVEHPVR